MIDEGTGSKQGNGNDWNILQIANCFSPTALTLSVSRNFVSQMKPAHTLIS